MQGLRAQYYDTLEEFQQALEEVFARLDRHPNFRFFPNYRTIVEYEAMPPKAAGAKGSLTNDAFLVVCVKHAKEKLRVDFDAIAKETKMSRGGVENKFRAVMRTIEEQGATWGKPVANHPTKMEPNAKGGKRRATSAAAAIDDDAADSEDEFDAPPTAKKSKIDTKKGIAKVVKKPIKAKKISAAKGKKPASVKDESDGDEGGVSDVHDAVTVASSVASETDRAPTSDAD